MKYFPISCAVVVIIVSAFFSARVVFAGEILFSVVPNHEAHESVTVVEVELDTQGVALNAIQGTIAFLGTGADMVTSVLIETGDSIVSLWPIVPVYSGKDKVIQFTGGSMEAFPSKGTLFRMRIFSTGSAPLTLSWIGGNAYRNDGQGTEEAVSSRSLVLSLTQSTPDIISAASSDSAPPYFDALYVSRDDDVMNGNYFLSFHAMDALSGISHYEVVEDQVTTRIERDDVYVLRDQERMSKVVVIAYDQAGNSVSVKVPTKYAWVSDLVEVTILIGVCIMMVWWMLYARKKIIRTSSIKAKR